MTTDDSAPERAMLLALLKEAIETYCSRPRSEKQRHWREDAAKWFSGEYVRGDSGYTFGEVCEHLGLDESYMRRLVYEKAEVANKQSKDNYRVRLNRRRNRQG